MVTPHRLEVVTQDREVIADALNRIVEHRARVSFDEPGAADFAIRSATYGDFRAWRVRIGGVRYTATVPPLPMITAGVIAEGRALSRFGRAEMPLRAGDGVLFPEGGQHDGEYGNTVMLYVQVPHAYVAGVAGEPGLRFEANTPVSARMRRYWGETTAYLFRQLTAPGADLGPLLVEQLRRLAATSALCAFPHTAMTRAYRPGPGHEPASAVRRAVAYMEDNAARPLTVADIAAAAGVGARGLQAAFRRHLDTTPLERLRRIRLERVRQELRDADPGGGVTVREVARRWGFANPGRFAGQYRVLFGETPAETLRS
ncbi:AraC family transcriptional regulator [Catenuloplanes atrovinosus]|uniref:AraC-like DNA-binding protein n=1 Tax=Catenuloplanes atrovinosus TaxID=137266 RepID=A0AAE4C7A4_9ACTN|nr:helix-turn-helix transcriptional regulator [Catenuloplanes atrovinosus]MDR7274331.1 AraC-like DNA-binding protein [Catenuloplanes atrovinosus]